MNGAALDLSILGPALLAGLLVLATHVPMGMQVLDRGIVFMDLAIAQIAGLGVIAAHSFGWATNAWAVQAAALGAALLGAMLLTYTEKRAVQLQEALIGVLFVLAASGAILLLSSHPHGAEQVKDLLVGQILWVSAYQLAALASVSIVLLALWFGLRERMGRFGFYALFAIAVTASVQLVGVYLVFSSLIIPALASRKWQGKKRLAIAYGVGILGYVSGLLLSAMWDLPSAALMVWMLAAMGMAVAWIGRRGGNALT